MTWKAFNCQLPVKTEDFLRSSTHYTDLFLTNWIIPYPSHSHLVMVKGFTYNMGKNILLGNKSELKVVFQQHVLVGKNCQFFFWTKHFHRVSLLMSGKWIRVKMWRSYMVFWQHQKVYFSIILQVKKRGFYSCKEIFIRSGYNKLLLKQGYMLSVINMNFYVPVCQFSPVSSFLL